MLVRANGEAVDAGSMVQGSGRAVATHRLSARTATVELQDFVAEQRHDADVLAAWQRFYHAQRQDAACPLPGFGFECDKGHTCTFKENSQKTFTISNFGGLTETVFNNSKTVYLISEPKASPEVPPYYLLKLTCNGDVLVKAPAAESGDQVNKKTCSDSKVVEDMTWTTPTPRNATASVEKLTEKGYLCIDANVSGDDNVTGREGVCLLSKTPVDSGPPSIDGNATTVNVTRQQLFEILGGKFDALQGKLDMASCPGGEPLFSLAEVGALATVGNMDMTLVGKGGGVFSMIFGGVLMAAAFVLTGVSGGAFAPVATIVFGWGAGFVISGAATEFGGHGTGPSGAGVVGGMTGLAGPAGAGIAGIFVGGSALADSLASSDVASAQRVGQAGNSYLKSRYDSYCADYHLGNMNVYMHPCHGGGNQKWSFAERAWLQYSNDPQYELIGRSTTPLRSMQHWGERDLNAAKTNCANNAQCQAFCWNPDDYTFYHQQTNQGFQHTGSYGQGWQCYKKAFFDGKALVTLHDNKCADYHYGNNNVYMHDCHGGTNQQWYFDGEQLKTRYDSKCLDYNYNDKNLYMHPCHGGSNQKFYFTT